MQEFAINYKILIAQIINFGIVLFLLKKFAYKPVLDMLEERKNKIAQGLEDAEKARAELEQANTKVREIIDEAHAEAKKIKEEIKGVADKEAKEIVAKSDQRAKQILDLANSEAAKAKEKALADVRQHMASLIILSLEKIVGNELDKNQREKITTKTIKDL